MTQQKPLPIATGITGGCNAPSSFHPGVPPRDKIWACCWRDAAAAKTRSVGRALQGGRGGLVQGGLQALAKEIQPETRIQGRGGGAKAQETRIQAGRPAGDLAFTRQMYPTFTTNGSCRPGRLLPSTRSSIIAHSWLRCCSSRSLLSWAE